MIALAVCSSVDLYLHPYIISTSQHGKDFICMATSNELATLAIRYEAYCVAGVEGESIVLLSFISC